MGLKMGTVRLEKYNENWKREFEEEKKNLREIFQDIAINIEHIGSTSIENISAKPILDIAVAFKELSDFEKVKDYFINNKEYSVREENTPGEILVSKGTAECITHLIHIMKYDSERYKNTIIFRDYLKKNLEDKKEYEKLKQELAEKYNNNRKMYTASKHEFIQKILEKAKKQVNKIDKTPRFYGNYRRNKLKQKTKDNDTKNEIVL